MAADIDRVCAAAVDGRLRNPIWRKEQLFQLHQAFAKDADKIQAAILQDSHGSVAEVAVELRLALDALKKCYLSLDLDKELEMEYRIAKGLDDQDRSDCPGLVYIEPTPHTMFFSVVAALAPAIAAGNCVILLLENTMRAVPTLLRTMLPPALDSDIFSIARTKVADPDVLSKCTQVLQNGIDAVSTVFHLVSQPNGLVVAVVDRTADITQAAQALVMARFAYGSASPYAPGLVLVHETVKKQFLLETMKHSIRMLPEHSLASGKQRNQFSNGDPAGNLHSGQDKDGVRIIFPSSAAAIVEVENRDSSLAQKLSEQCLCVCSITSLDDAIDFSNRYVLSESPIACFAFASAQAAKYICQYVRSDIGFVNHIPFELLVGPAAPINRPFSLESRYCPSFFSKPTPRFVKSSAQSILFQAAVLESNEVAISRILEGAVEKLPEPKRPKRLIPRGFFEEGVRTGAIVVFSPLLISMTAAGYFGAKALYYRVLQYPRI
ncbi:hypothetical protein P152DRAFT_428480 [Eremomyces bilateralis CBS 781.70]|uniref:ALDH-like protein n=1 Tax=Eremomyces bilateralis CBS 781.70 TaxID=1392243 RepID=A0A6G1GET9_9PEZI|nr:uncharacterized protein P152DRAFT_428480 [Eremomyces bilateralis CBS 781.70]KAF1816421.1 hypothetical protein P152DRAFT_428480 [Eremomyces bilateralis CBS 781.70]